MTVKAQRTRLERLTDYLWKNNGKPFTLGAHDCALFACRWVDEELGTAYEKRVLEFYKDHGVGNLRREIAKPGAYRALIEKVTKRKPREDQDWTVGAVAVFAQENGAETLGVLTKLLVHAPGLKIPHVVSTSTQRVRCYWSLECLAP
jgi:hypothetical protein